MQERLTKIGIFGPGDLAILEGIHRRTSTHPAGHLLQPENGAIENARIMLSGWAVRFRSLASGDRQIINFVLPGDCIGLYGALFERTDFGVELITDASFAEFPCAALMSAFHQSARLGAALCWMAAQDERMLEQQVFRLGALNATTRIAHLLVELQHRLLTAGIKPVEAMSMPITQKHIGEALGLSHVHVNRCCRKLKKLGLIEIGAHGLTLLEPGELRQLCDFEPKKGPSADRADPAHGDLAVNLG